MLSRQAVGHIVSNELVICLPSIKTSSGYNNEPAGIAWFKVRLWHTSSISGSVSAIGRFRSEDTHFPKSSCSILSMMFSNSANWEPRCLQNIDKKDIHVCTSTLLLLYKNTDCYTNTIHATYFVSTQAKDKQCIDITINVPEHTFIYMIPLDFEVYLKLCTPASSWVRTSWVVEMRSRAPTNSWVDSSNCIVGCVWWTVAINFSCNTLYIHIHVPPINLVTKPINLCATINAKLFLHEHTHYTDLIMKIDIVRPGLR